MKEKKTNNDLNLEGLKKVEEACELLTKTSKTKFVSSVDVDVTLAIKESQKKESMKGSVTLPHKFGADKKIIVLCEEKDVAAAKKAGASEAGLDELKEKVMNGQVEFDIVIATPSVMPKIIQLGKVLGPKGLMPNPKNGTVTTDIDAAVKSFSSGKMNFKMQADQGVVRAKIANLQMTSEQIKENMLAFFKAVSSESRRLSSAPFKKVTVKTTMGPSIKLDVSDIIANIS